MQETKNIPRLCGGTFFTLLRNACNETIYNGRETTRVKDSDVFLLLLKMYQPSFTNDKPRTLQNYTSSFKSCASMDRNKLHFDKQNDVKAFDARFFNNYDYLFEQMSSLIDQYININKLDWLISALVELIDQDTSINKDDMLYVGHDGTPLSKQELVNLIEIPASAFLLGIWHFIILNRQDNTVGESTYKSWHTDSGPQTKRPFISTIGLSSKIKPIIDYHTPGANKDCFIIHTAPIDTEPSLGKNPNYDIPSDKDPYFLSAYNEYASMKTLLYNTSEKPFYSFFECNDVGEFDAYDEEFYDDSVIHNCTISKLTKISRYIILAGTGGIGKSMMMRHLFLDSLRNEPDRDRLPILMEVRNYKPQKEELDSYIYREYLRLNGAMKQKAFEEKLTEGKISLLFDGLDEINQQDFMGFCTKLNSLIIKYPNNTFIISSRPFIRFIHLHRFITYAIHPLSKQQALSLIDKLEYKPNTPEIKESFRKEVDSALFASHTEFCQNPLLLTIMLLMYELFAHIPSRMHLFYQQAYLTLASHHDGTKESYNRTLATGLDTDQFENVFAEFCARSYHDECYSLSNEDMHYYYGELHSLEDIRSCHSCTDFIHDIKDNLCLMYHDGYYYNFIHRSFQEYFCALYFSRKLDCDLYDVGLFFDKRMDYSVSDNTFSMLYAMIPRRAERYIFFRFLDDMFKRCKNDYLLFLKEQYNEIFYWDGTIDEDDIEPVEAASYIYREFCRIHGFTHKPIRDHLPADKHYLLNHYYYVENDRWDDVNWIDNLRFERKDTDISKLKPEDPIIIAYHSIEPDYFEVYEEQLAGISYRMDISSLVAEIERDVVDNTKIINALEDDAFPLMEEYNAVYNYYIKLKNKYDQIAPDQRALLFDD